MKRFVAHILHSRLNPCSTLYRVVLNETEEVADIIREWLNLQYPLSGRTK